MPSTTDRAIRTKPCNSLRSKTPNKIRRKIKNQHGDKYIENARLENDARSQFNIKTEVKEEVVDDEFEGNLMANSIIGQN